MNTIPTFPCQIRLHKGRQVDATKQFPLVFLLPFLPGPLLPPLDLVCPSSPLTPSMCVIARAAMVPALP